MSAFRQMRKLSLASLATLSLVATGTAMAQATPTEESTTSASPAAVDPVTLDLVGINDFHGRIATDRDSAGAAVLAGAVDQLRAENENTLFLSAGDNIGASTFASASQEDAPTIDALGAAGLDVSVVGNHEFDKGFEDLTSRVTDRFAAATGQPGEDYALGANVYKAGTKTPALKEYAIREVGGLSVGFIGTVTEDVPSLVSPSGISGLDFGSEVEAANRVAKDLSDGDDANGEADVIVLLTHNGSASTDCSAIASETTSYGDLVRKASGDIDAIFSGHTHSSYDCSIAGPDGERPVIQSHQYGTTLGKVSLNVDPTTGEVLDAFSTRLPLATESADGEWTANYEANPTVAKIVEEAEAEAEVVGSVEVGKISEDILRGGDVPGSDRGVESTLGNTVADIHLWATSNEDFAGEPAQIAFMNPGGLRSDLLYGEDGTVTYKAAAEVQPFANTLITFDLTGAQIREALEQQWQPEGSERNKLHLGISDGLSYTYIEDAAAGEHIQEITFNGEPLDESATFRVAANAFLATGGDNFTAFAEGANHADSGQIDLDATVNYFKAHDVVEPAPLGRAAAIDPEAPSESPSESPSETPTESPSETPDESPTASPSESTSEDPSSSPSSDESNSAEPTQSSDSPAEPTEDSSDDSNQQDNEDLADTGFSASWIGIAAGVIVLAGIVLLLIRRFGNKAGR
ncbi:Endonuclease YhcR precursor [compost metagenome]